MDIAKTLNHQKKELLHQVARIDAAIHALFGKTDKRKGRKVSAAAKRKMSLAAKKRWAAIKSKK